MTISPLAGTLLPPSALVDVPRLVTAYFTITPDPANPAQRVAFGTSGHRGSAYDGTFNEAHILAISQAVCQHRRAAGVDGRCSSASTRTLCPAPHWPPRSRSSSPTTWMRSSTSTTATRPLR